MRGHMTLETPWVSVFVFSALGSTLGKIVGMRQTKRLINTARPQSSFRSVGLFRTIRTLWKKKTTTTTKRSKTLRHDGTRLSAKKTWDRAIVTSPPHRIHTWWSVSETFKIVIRFQTARFLIAKTKRLVHLYWRTETRRRNRHLRLGSFRFGNYVYRIVRFSIETKTKTVQKGHRST